MPRSSTARRWALAVLDHLFGRFPGFLCEHFDDQNRIGVDAVDNPPRHGFIHDAKLDRTTNGRGYVSRKTFAQLRALDAGLGERIPTLREVFETVDRRAFINIELKGRRTAGPVRALIAEFVERHGWRYEDFVVSSFLRTELRAITDPRIPIALLLTRPTKLYALSAQSVRASSVNPALRFVTQRFVENAHRRGLKVFVYTVNEPEDIARMREWGVDGVFTDFPERALAS